MIDAKYVKYEFQFVNVIGTRKTKQNFDLNKQIRAN